MAVSSNQISLAQSDFSASLLKNLSATESGSFVASPVSVLSVLAMLYLGARNKTAKELGDALGNGASTIEVAKYYGALAGENDIFEAANKIYLESGFSLKKCFLKLFTKYFGSDGIENVNFENSEATAKLINDFVSNATHGRIQNLISPDALDASVVMVLVNAIYFLKTWQREFNTNETASKPFYISQGNSVQLSQMHAKDKFGYFEDDQVQVLRMNYTGGDAFMVVALPKDPYGLDNVVNSVNGAKLLTWIRNSLVQKVEVQFPKFKTESTFNNLAETLEAMGLKTMFSPSLADFSGISTTKQIYAQKAIQKAFIQVAENGTEAAAATAVIIRTTAVINEPEEPKFIANHPFIYFICDKDDNVLFVGVFRGK